MPLHERQASILHLKHFYSISCLPTHLKRSVVCHHLDQLKLLCVVCGSLGGDNELGLGRYLDPQHVEWMAALTLHSRQVVLLVSKPVCVKSGSYTI